MFIANRTNTHYIIKCEKCGAVIEKHKRCCKQYGVEYWFNPPLTCFCGNSSKIIFVEDIENIPYVNTKTNNERSQAILELKRKKELEKLRSMLELIWKKRIVLFSEEIQQYVNYISMYSFDNIEFLNRECLINMLKLRTPYIERLNVNSSCEIYIDEIIKYYKESLYPFMLKLEKKGICVYKHEDEFVDILIDTLKTKYTSFNENHNLKLLTIRQHPSWTKFIENINKDIITIIGWLKMDVYDVYMTIRENRILLFMYEDIHLRVDLINEENNQLQFMYFDKSIRISTDSNVITTFTFEIDKQLSIFRRHFELINERNIIMEKEEQAEKDKRERKISERVSKIVEDMLIIDEIKNLSKNFLKSYFKNIFLSTKYIGQNESAIYDVIKTGNYIYLTHFEKLEKHSFGKCYLNEEFEMFVEVIGNKYIFNNFAEKLLSCWLLLYQLSIELYEEEWKMQYGEYFIKIDNMSLSDCIEQYCNINILDIKVLNDDLNIGKFVFYLIENNKFNGIVECEMNYLICLNYTKEKTPEYIRIRKLDGFEKSLRYTSQEQKITIDDADLMNGYEFENLISLIFSKMGYYATVTKGSGDQGIDIIAEKNNIKIGVQAKCYINQVSNSAIQEVVAGIKHYNLDKAIVITNNYFTKSAHELAKSNNVVLWDRNMLKEKITDLL